MNAEPQPEAVTLRHELARAAGSMMALCVLIDSGSVTEPRHLEMIRKDAAHAAALMQRTAKALAVLDISSRRLFAVEVATGPAEPTPSEN